MLHRLRPKLTYANVVASLALFIALGGSAYAIGAGTIGSRDIRDNSIRSRDVRNNALTGRDINEQTLRSAPKIYIRSSGRTITLGRPPGESEHVASCNPGDRAISGTVGGTGEAGLRSQGNFRSPSSYVGVLFSDPPLAGQTRFLNVAVVCLARARR